MESCKSEFLNLRWACQKQSDKYNCECKPHRHVISVFTTGKLWMCKAQNVQVDRAEYATPDYRKLTVPDSTTLSNSFCHIHTHTRILFQVQKGTTDDPAHRDRKQPFPFSHFTNHAEGIMAEKEIIRASFLLCHCAH